MDKPVFMKKRLPAEWEPQSAVQFTFPSRQSDWTEVYAEAATCIAACIEAAARYQKVLVICEEKGEARRWLRNAAAENLRIIEVPTNDTWCRDYGGITVLQNKNPIVYDFIFNGWGLKFPANHDNEVTRRLFENGIFRTAELQNPGLVLEGGSIESDGEGTLLTTEQCLLARNRNDNLTKSELENELKELFGLERILWLANGHLQGDDTDGHIDTLARFCDSETIAYVQCNDPADDHCPALRKMEAEIRQFRTLGGACYRLVPLPLPAAQYSPSGERLPATYANFLILNGAVLLPVYGVVQDGEAIDRLGRVFADREVIPIDCRPLIEQGGSLHCLSMQYPKGVIL